jgi:hypothetical protein
MAKLQLMQAGYTSYTGRLGTVEFVNGVSQSDVDPNTAAGLAALFTVQWQGGALVDQTDPTNQFLGNGVDAVSAAVAAGVGRTTAQVVSAGKSAEAASTTGIDNYSGEFFSQASASEQTGTAFVQTTPGETSTVDQAGIHITKTS